MIIQDCDIQTDQRGQDLKAYGTGLMPAACYDDDLIRCPVPWHWHDELEVGVVQTGEVCLSTGTQRLIIKAGDGFFINAGVLHSAFPNGGAGTTLHSIVFHPRLIGGSADSIFWERYLLPLMENKCLEGIYLPLGEKWGAAIRSIETAWTAGAAEDFGYEFVMRSALSEFILALCRHTPIQSTPPSEKVLRDSERMKCMLAYIQEHFSEEVTVAEIAASASISKSECLRCFKNIVNSTPIQYVRQYRLQHAAELLVSTDLKVADVGAACGFQEMSYFARAFQEYKGYTPKAYREQASDPVISRKEGLV